MTCLLSEWLIDEEEKIQFFGHSLNGGHLPLSGENGILRANERLATDDEARRMMAEMSPELEHIYRAARLLKVRCFHLGALLVEDVDTERRVARIDGAERKLSKRAFSMVSVAIAEGDVQAVNYFVAQNYTQALKEVAAAPNAKTIMIPLEAASLMGSIAGIGELAKDAMKKQEG